MYIDVPQYGPSFKFIWEDGFAIRCRLDDSAVIIEANRAGLISLARHLLVLADENAPEFTHFHLDEWNSLEEKSTELIVVKRNLI